MSAATVVVPLESEACLDPRRVGAKAARLAEALRLGLPVVPGLVIPAEVSERVLAEASRDIAERGVHAARLAVMGGTLPTLAALPQTLIQLGDDLVVRSSSPLEGSPEYAGAFTSYVGVTATEAVTAVRGVWASALPSHDMTHDEQEARRRPAVAPRMAVLVQLHIPPSFAGTARVERDRKVHVVAVAGPSAPLMSGWVRGELATVGLDSVVAGPAASTVGERMLLQVATIARRVYDELGDDLIEWAASDESALLFQSQRAARRSEPVVVTRAPDVPPEAAGVARLVHAFAGALGDAFVLPFILAGVAPEARVPSTREHGAITAQTAYARWADAHQLAERLLDLLWGGDVTLPEHLLAMMRAGDIASAVATFASLPGGYVTDITSLIDNLRLVGHWLENSSILLSADDIWGVPPREVEGLITGRSAATATAFRERRRRALARWEPVVFAAVAGTGTAIHGEPASPGFGAGEGVVIPGIPTSRPNIPRMVVVAPLPIPQLAPLMWGSAGLVTAGGGASAHLVEVARSRGVPAVVGCDDVLFSLLERRHASPPLIAVDGDRGRVAISAPAVESVE